MAENFVKLDMAMAEAIAKTPLKNEAFRVLMFLIRRLHGWGKEEDVISLSQITEGTNIARHNIPEIRRRLIEANIISVTNIPTEGGMPRHIYRINRQVDTWNLKEKTVKSVPRAGDRSVIHADNSFDDENIPDLTNFEEKVLSTQITEVLSTQITEVLSTPITEVLSTQITTIDSYKYIKENFKESVPTTKKLLSVHAPAFSSSGAIEKDVFCSEFFFSEAKNIGADGKAEPTAHEQTAQAEQPAAVKPGKKPRKSKVSEENATVVAQLTELLIAQIQKVHPTSLMATLPVESEKARRNWAPDIDKLIRLDKRTVLEIREMILWATEHHFWSTNILSGRKLRGNWETMNAQKGRKNGKSSNGNNSNGQHQSNLEAIRKHAKKADFVDGKGISGRDGDIICEPAFSQNHA